MNQDRGYQGGRSFHQNPNYGNRPSKRRGGGGNWNGRSSYDRNYQQSSSNNYQQYTGADHSTSFNQGHTVSHPYPSNYVAHQNEQPYGSEPLNMSHNNESGASVSAYSNVPSVQMFSSSADYSEVTSTNPSVAEMQSLSINSEGKSIVAGMQSLQINPEGTAEHQDSSDEVHCQVYNIKSIKITGANEAFDNFFKHMLDTHQNKDRLLLEIEKFPNVHLEKNQITSSRSLSAEARPFESRQQGSYSLKQDEKAVQSYQHASQQQKYENRDQRNLTSNANSNKELASGVPTGTVEVSVAGLSETNAASIEPSDWTAPVPEVTEQSDWSAAVPEVSEHTNWADAEIERSDWSEAGAAETEEADWSKAGAVGTQGKMQEDVDFWEPEGGDTTAGHGDNNAQEGKINNDRRNRQRNEYDRRRGGENNRPRNGQGNTKRNYKIVNEKSGDLFEAPADHSLAHCVGEDLRMGSGIAVTFKQMFKNVGDLMAQKKKVGQVAILEDKGRYIYYLITKKLSNGKPFVEDLQRALVEMKEHCAEKGVKNLSMPRIGCGLDRLEWNDVKPRIEEIFSDLDINITVYNFNSDKEDTKYPSSKPKAKFNYASYPLVDIESQTGLVFFGAEDGTIDDCGELLDKKYNFLFEYRKETKVVGNVLRFEKRQEYIYGLVIKKKKSDPFSYINMEKCLLELRKQVKKDKTEYVGFQAFCVDDDDLAMEKFITLVRNIFFMQYNEVYFCYPKELEYLREHRYESNRNPSNDQVGIYSEKGERGYDSSRNPSNDKAGNFSERGNKNVPVWGNGERKWKNESRAAGQKASSRTNRS